MICPDCKTEMRVRRTTPSGSDDAPTTTREHHCACGQKFVSVDRITRRLTAISTHRHALVDSKPPPIVINQPSNATNSVGGVGGGLSPIRPESDPIRSLSVSDPSLDHSLGVDRARAKRKGAPVYSPDFLKFWEFYPRKVGKGAAWKAWKTQQPEINRIIGTLGWQKNSQEWRKDQGIYVPHPATYLNQRRWEDEPIAKPPRPVLAAVPSAPLPQPPTPWTEEQQREARELTKRLTGSKSLETQEGNS